jgi:hypothetical protein
MANTPELSRYFAIVKRLRAGKEVPKEDIQFFYEYTPTLDQEKIQKFAEGGEFPSALDAQNAMIEAGRALQTSPEYKAQTLELAEQAESDRTTSRLAEGINLVLGAVDIGQSIRQIKEGSAAVARTKRPSRPAIPQRDLYLQQALRSAEEGTMNAGRALAPVEAQIQDQYYSDINSAKTGSSGQAGAYGALRQVAANRRNRAALELAPITDNIQAREQARYDQLLGMRQNETQQMFNNQASLYPYDLQQYNTEQQAAAGLQSQGRTNLRNSLYNMGNLASNAYGRANARRKYDMLRNQMSMYGDRAADMAVKAQESLDGYTGNMTIDDTPQYWEQAY